MSKWISFFIFTFLVSYSSYGFELGVSAGVLSKTLTGVDDATDTEGKLIANSNLQYGVHTSIPFSAGLRFDLNYYNRKIVFDNTKDVIEGEDTYQADMTNFGIRWIIHPRIGLRFLYNLSKEISFEVNPTDQAVVDVEQVNYVSVHYDQIVFLGGSSYSGFRLGYETNADGENIEDRQGTLASVFAVIGGLDLSYNIAQIKKFRGDLSLEENDSFVSAKYTAKF